MIVHSWGSSLPGLLMISLGIAILPTSCRSAANSRLRRRSGLSAELVGEVEGEADDALAVLAGVAVVGLDDVAEDERGAAVGAARARACSRGACWRSRANTASRPEERQQRQRGQRGRGGCSRRPASAGARQRRVDPRTPSVAPSMRGQAAPRA